MSPDDAVPLLEKTLQIYSPTAKERELAAYLHSIMKGFGYSVEDDAAGNVLGKVGDGPIKILLCGHMDTVPGRLPVRVREGLVYGRGSVDAKSALCAIILSGREFLSSDKVQLTVACVTREEGDGLGIRTLLDSGEKYDYAVFGEPSGSGKITIGYRGRFGVKVSVKTEGGHASSPWAHVSALDESLALLAGLKKYAMSRSMPNDHYRSVSLCCTMMKAGSYENVIPRDCRMILDVRVPVGASCRQVSSELARIVEGHGREHKRVRLKVDFGEETEPYEAKVDSIVVRAFQRAIIKRTGGRPIMVKKTGTGDMNTFGNAMNCACVTYGPGDPELSHTQSECVQIDDYLESIDVLSSSIHEIASLHQNAKTA